MVFSTPGLLYRVAVSNEQCKDGNSSDKISLGISLPIANVSRDVYRYKQTQQGMELPSCITFSLFLV